MAVVMIIINFSTLLLNNKQDPQNQSIASSSPESRSSVLDEFLHEGKYVAAAPEELLN